MLRFGNIVLHPNISNMMSFTMEDTPGTTSTYYAELQAIFDGALTPAASLINETSTGFIPSHHNVFNDTVTTIVNKTFLTAELTFISWEMTSSQLTQVPTFATTEDGKIVSDELRNIFEIMNFVILSGIISLFGSVANVINVIVFAKQGFSDTVNISLLGLAVSDFGALITLLWMSICFNPLFRDSGIAFDSIKVQYLTAGWPHVCFARITSWITAYVTLERCLCIALPLKVKTIITPRRTICVIISIFVILMAAVSPVYYAIHLGPVYYEERNETLISLVYRDNGADIENASFAVNVFAQLSSFVIVIICTIILVQSLMHKTQWRKTSTSSESLTLRDKRVIKMIISLSVIFIACFLPSAVNLIIMILTPGYSIVGPYQVGWSFLNTLEATNSSVNILVYYNMSSRYRVVFNRLFFPKGTQQRNNNYSTDTAE